MPIHVDGVLLHAMSGTELSHVAPMQYNSLERSKRGAQMTRGHRRIYGPLFFEYPEIFSREMQGSPLHPR